MRYVVIQKNEDGTERTFCSYPEDMGERAQQHVEALAWVFPDCEFDLVPVGVSKGLESTINKVKKQNGDDKV